MSVTISSEVPATLLLTLHPVSCSKPVTKSRAGSEEPFSTFAAHDTMLTEPSPAPNDASLSIFGGVMPPGPVPEGPVLSVPQPATASTAAAAKAVASLIVLICHSPLSVLVRMAMLGPLRRVRAGTSDRPDAHGAPPRQRRWSTGS